jgi:hypothetical protein
MTGLRSEEQVRGQRSSRVTARHTRKMLSTVAGVCASFGQEDAVIGVRISRSEKVRNEGDPR